MKTETKNELLKVGVLAALVVAAMPEMSWAAGDGFNQYAQDLSNDQLVGIPYVVTVMGYLIGTVLMLSGALSLKKHAENPAGEPLNKGLGRLAVGGLITSIPMILRLMQETTDDGTTGGASYQSFTGLGFTP